MIIINVKYGKKRIGVAKVDNANCLAEAEKKFKEYKKWDYPISSYGYRADYSNDILKQKNYIESEGGLICIQ